MRLPLLAALALDALEWLGRKFGVGVMGLLLVLAVGASATTLRRAWLIDRPGAVGMVRYVSVAEEDDGKVRLRVFAENAITFRYADLTSEEAASLGRALLEAAGQPEKACPAPIQFAPFNNGETQVCTCNSVVGGTCVCTPNINAIPLGGE